MRLLLLLSALLSALTGVGANARVPDVAQAVAGRNVVAAAIAPARRSATVRPAVAPPSIESIAAYRAPAYSLAAIEPIWATRRRE